MENRSLCEHCGGELFYSGDDQWWECSDCGCAWRPDGQLMRRGAECTAPHETAVQSRTLPPIHALEDVAD